MALIRPDVIVMGVPRSGTSNTARILHEILGVCMGHKLSVANYANPKGFYEDVHMQQISVLLGNRPDATSPADWLEAFTWAHKKFGCTSKLRGVKQPGLADVTQDDLHGIHPRLIVRTWRPKKVTMESLRYHRGGREPFDVTNDHYDRREWNMTKVLSGWKHCPVACVRYDSERTDEEIAEELLPYIIATRNVL